MFWKILIFGGFAIVVIAVAVPELNRWYARLFTQSEEVAVMRGSSADTEQTLEIATLLGFDAIPAIVEPRFVSAAEAEAWMLPDEQVLALSINGESRAYPINVLSRHEIVNDVVGGVPVAVTW